MPAHVAPRARPKRRLIPDPACPLAAALRFGAPLWLLIAAAVFGVRG